MGLFFGPGGGRTFLKAHHKNPDLQVDKHFTTDEEKKVLAQNRAALKKEALVIRETNIVDHGEL